MHHAGPGPSVRDCEMDSVWGQNIPVWVIKEQSPGVRRPEFSSVLDMCPLECHLTALPLGFPSCKVGIRTWLPCRVEVRTEQSKTHQVPASSRSMSPPGICHVGLFPPLSSENNEPKSPVDKLFFFKLQNSFLKQNIVRNSNTVYESDKRGVVLVEGRGPQSPTKLPSPLSEDA